MSEIDRCPNCKADLDLAKYHSYYDYANEFQATCTKCEALLNVEVEAEPVFHVTEEQEDDERQMHKP